MDSTALLCPDPEQLRPRKRRGATSIEYVFMASLILVACILAVQHLGQITRGIMSNNANKTAVMNVGDK